MEQIKALNALEPFLALTKSATSPRAAIDLITRATAAPGTYIFTELLLAPQIQALSTASPEQAAYLSLLKIFSYGTYLDYTSDSSLPTLSSAQTLKLRQLSFLTLAKSPSDLTYPKLQSALSLSTPRDLEDLVISTIYAGLITCTLDPYNQTVLVSSISPLRDLPPSTIPSMLSTLSAWSARCTTTLSSLESQIASIKAEAQRRHRDEKEWNAHVASLLETPPPAEPSTERAGIMSSLHSLTGKMTKSSGKRNATLENLGSDEEMDDVDSISGQQMKDTRSSKKRGFGGLGFGNSTDTGSTDADSTRLSLALDRILDHESM
ncbi:hypothetical protein sscle_05g041500 [Sclerotinia sclerotiorum 1980 UF-70]|uniref:PCI domain-containing protein n=1 Tax=Sclerotinia sclerotiorum (strain ATCC 18683 / 1980 / Ss-1) TaxID=665079 RepID=A0A1D9Q335_SCLS1|nr:hypothetical protein sscle_05g041500 [Sclerotinia sclerotiorum 1980 UF-70]